MRYPFSSHFHEEPGLTPSRFHEETFYSSRFHEETFYSSRFHEETCTRFTRHLRYVGRPEPFVSNRHFRVDTIIRAHFPEETCSSHGHDP